MIVIDMDKRVLILYKYFNCHRCNKYVSKMFASTVRFNTNNYGGTRLKGFRDDSERVDLPRFEPVFLFHLTKVSFEFNFIMIKSNCHQQIDVGDNRIYCHQIISSKFPFDCIIAYDS